MIVLAAGANYWQALASAGAAVTALTTVGAALVWILKPRVVDWLEQLNRDARLNRERLDPERPGSTAANVHETAGLAKRVYDLEDASEPLPAMADALREHRQWLERVEVEMTAHRRRLATLEEAVITGRISHAAQME